MTWIVRESYLCPSKFAVTALTQNFDVNSSQELEGEMRQELG